MSDEMVSSIGLGSIACRHTMATGNTQVDLWQLASLRHETYQLLGAMLLYPDGPTIVAVSEASRILLNQNQWASALAFFESWAGCLGHYKGLSVAQLGDLQGEYNSLFSGGNQVQPVSLYESVYLEQTVAETGQVMADLEREYASLGLTISPDKGESPDHAALEMEFIAFLCEQEARAWERGTRPEAEKAIFQQRRFLDQHPCRWLPYLARAVASRDRSSLYALTVQAAHAVTTHDVDFLELLLKHMGQLPRRGY
ncbi:MAG: molecular chaperone [Dehalococcoidia bacterium]